jgi:hypothetical protein
LHNDSAEACLVRVTFDSVDKTLVAAVIPPIAVSGSISSVGATLNKFEQFAICVGSSRLAGFTNKSRITGVV